MTLQVDLSEAAAEELDEAARWYDLRRAGVGEELLDEIQRALGVLAEHPELGSLILPDRRVRRLPLRRFPYQVIYRLGEDSVTVVALAHTSRRPGYWRDRL